MPKRFVHKFFAPSTLGPLPKNARVNAAPDAYNSPSLTHIVASGAQAHNLKALMREKKGFPLPDWDAVATQHSNFGEWLILSDFRRAFPLDLSLVRQAHIEGQKLRMAKNSCSHKKPKHSQIR